MPKARKNLSPHHIEILKVLCHERLPISRQELYRQLSFKNWLGKYLGTPGSPGRYPDSLFEMGLVAAEDSCEEGRFAFYATQDGKTIYKKLKNQKLSA